MDLKKRNADMRDFFNLKAEGYDNVHMKMILNKDRITELLEVLLSCALCRDPGAYLATRALLLDAIEDMRRPESFSLLSR